MTNDTTRSMPLGIEGFTYADLHQPARLRDLHTEFSRQTAALDPALWAEWESYGRDPEALRPATAVSDLIVRMAPHVSRFLVRLFTLNGAAEHLRAETHDLDVLFRFKVDFVRKRSVPLVKGGAHVHRDPADVAVVERLIHPYSNLDRESAVAAAGCALLDREAYLREDGSDDDKAMLAVEVDALKRWCASCLHDPEYKSWVTFKFPETVDYQNLVQVQRPRPDLKEAMIGPDALLRRRDGFGLTDPRMTPRGVEAETQYCLICHDREKDSCSKGFFDEKTSTFQKNPLGVPLTGCPLDEKISEIFSSSGHPASGIPSGFGVMAPVLSRNPFEQESLSRSWHSTQ